MSCVNYVSAASIVTGLSMSLIKSRVCPHEIPETANSKRSSIQTVLVNAYSFSPNNSQQFSNFNYHLHHFYDPGRAGLQGGNVSHLAASSCLLPLSKSSVLETISLTSS